MKEALRQLRHEFFHHEFTQSELRRRYENQALENQGARQEIISMLFVKLIATR